MASHLPEGLSPDSVDTLTELMSIVVKLRSAQAAASGGMSTPALGNLVGLPNISGTTGAMSIAGGPSGATPTLGAMTGSTPLAGGIGAAGSGTGMLSIKGLPAATDNLKHKLQRARALVKTLPDVGRSIAQQEAEISELEERRRRQVAMLARIKDEGLQFASAEQSTRDEGERMVE
ncbi:RNA polymerase II transcription mediator complex subunit 9-domain-containing protein [Lasiosphaeria miniovina]|uniref:Mediator of RNA polymerase II transcription subunit 9 n=1 Tax=Lasiosphaeria miniovina TaxID=1954250 RepID=A0AA40AC47_9PEZI|nr:RNA polymerase II transcription mediator complex subunit 9-domain-containing protein [Lasiosphaeria miniovina]KAK0713117.1 RNA polymerase II transcription mediator complex subunit 9-domain-containing protein [Lasiosphaeria miniovina]